MLVLKQWLGGFFFSYTFSFVCLVSCTDCCYGYASWHGCAFRRNCFHYIMKCSQRNTDMCRGVTLTHVGVEELP